MVEAAMKIARERGALTFTLDDISVKRLPSGEAFRLANMYFLTTGATWYESIVPGLRPMDAAAANKIAVWRERVRTNRWNDVARELTRWDVSAPEVDMSVDPGAIGSAMVVLRAIKEAQTDFFAKHEEAVLAASFIGNLYGLTWIAEL
jgi:hypothetical protein